MTPIQRLTANEIRNARAPAARAAAPRRKRSRIRTRRARAKPVDSTASTGSSKKPAFSFQGMKIADFYRPLKKPITLRLDADVLAWFKKDGSRYQTRINSALRTIMEREMKTRTTGS